MPEWMYIDCYDERHKIIEVSRLSETAVRRQKGFYDSFICKFCEEETQKYDHYASLVLMGRSPASAEYTSVKKDYVCERYEGATLQFAKWQGLNFRKFQNFVFSVILRTHFANRIEGPILLTQKHLDGILTIYNGQQLDDSSYPILLLEYPKTDKLRNHIILPYITKKADHHVIEFAGGGYAFNIYVSNHAKPRYVKSLSLKKDGTIYSIIESFSNTRLFRGITKIVQSVKRVPRNV